MICYKVKAVRTCTGRLHLRSVQLSASRARLRLYQLRLQQKMVPRLQTLEQTGQVLLLTDQKPMLADWQLQQAVQNILEMPQRFHLPRQQAAQKIFEMPQRLDLPQQQAAQKMILEKPQRRDLPQQQAAQKMILEKHQRRGLPQQQAAQKILETPQMLDLPQQQAAQQILETPQGLVWTDQMKVLAGQSQA